MKYAIPSPQRQPKPIVTLLLDSTMFRTYVQRTFDVRATCPKARGLPLTHRRLNSHIPTFGSVGVAKAVTHSSSTSMQQLVIYMFVPLIQICNYRSSISHLIHPRILSLKQSRTGYRRQSWHRTRDCPSSLGSGCPLSVLR